MNSENPSNMVSYFKLKDNFIKYWLTAKNTGKVRGICQSEKVGTMQCVQTIKGHRLTLVRDFKKCSFFHMMIMTM